MSARAAETVPRKAGRIPRWARWVGAALFLLLATLAVLYLGRERLLVPMILARAKQVVRSATGLELGVKRVGGNWWSELRLEGVELSGDTPTTEVTGLSLASVRVAYDIPGLLRGDPAAIQAIEVDGGRLGIDLARVLGPPPAQKAWDAPAAVFPWPQGLPSVDARGLQLDFVLPGGRLARLEGLSAVHGDAEASAATRWQVHAERGWFSDPDFGERAGSMDAQVSYRGGVFSAPSLELAGQAVGRELEVDLRGVAAADVRFSGTLQLFGELDFRGAVAADTLQVWLDARDFELAELLAELRIPSSLAGRANLGGLFRMPLSGAADWDAQAWGRIDELRFRGREFDRFSFAGNFDQEQLELREGSLLNGANSLGVSDFRVSFADTELDAILRSLRGSAELELFDPRAILGDATAEVLEAADRVRNARLSLDFRSAGLAVRTGEIRTDVGGLSIQRGMLIWGANDMPWYEGLGLDVDAVLSFEDLAPLAALFGQGDVTGSVAGTVALRGPALAPSGSFLLAGNGLSVQGYELGRVTIEARADKQHVELARLELDGESIQATASGNYDYASGELSDARFLGHSFALATLSGGRASADFVSVDATAAGPWRTPSVWARVKAWGLSVDGRTLERIDLEGVYANFCARIDRLTAEVAGVSVDAAGRVCRPSGSPDLEILVERARLEREELNLSLEAPLEVDLADGALDVTGLCIGGSAGHAIADLHWTDEAQQVSIDASELFPMQLLGPFLPAGLVIEGVHGSFSLQRTSDDLRADATMRVDQLQLFEGSPMAALVFDGRLVQSELEIRRLEASSPGHYSLAVKGRIPTAPLDGEWLSDGPFELEGQATIADFAALPRERLGLSPDWRGDATASFHLTGSASDVRGSLDATVNISGSPADSILGGGQAGAFQFEGLATIADEITLERTRLVLPDRGSADIDGRLQLRLDLKRWVAGELPDWTGLPVSLGAKLSAPDLRFVAGLSPVLRRTGGELHGEVRLEGSFREPNLTGAVDLSGAEVRLANALAAFENLSAHVELDRTLLHIVSLSGDYGAAPFQASGTIELGGPQPELNLQVTGDGLLLAREEGLRLRADADLKLVGPLNALKLSGDVTVVDGRFSEEIELVSLPGKRSPRRARKMELPFLRQAPWANMEFDVRVGSNKPIRVETNIARGTLEPHLELRGSGVAPRLGGTLGIGATRVKLPAATLEVTSGLLTFRGESSLVPDLDITALTRVRGYDITAQVGGTSADPELLFTSSPPLSSEELAVLVLTGQLPESALSAQGSEAAMQTVAVYLGRDLLTRWLGIEGDSEDPLSERLEFYRGAEVSQAGIESTEFIFRLTPNPRGKSRLLYLHAERDVFEKINFGVKLVFRFQ